MTTAIIGCGPSAENWFSGPVNFDLTIGVNDCAKFGRDPDWLVVVNRRFNSEREAVIQNTKPKRFLTTIDYWEKKFDRSERLRLQRFSRILKKGHVYSSKTSPFVALSLAFNAGSKDVVLFGVDLNDHPVVNGKLLNFELRQYENFCRMLAAQGTQVWVSSNKSALSKFLPVASAIGTFCNVEDDYIKDTE